MVKWLGIPVKATVVACKADEAVKMILDAVEQMIADDGNAEDMVKINKKGEPALDKEGNVQILTSHTLQPVFDEMAHYMGCCECTCRPRRLITAIRLASNILTSKPAIRTFRNDASTKLNNRNTQFNRFTPPHYSVDFHWKYSAESARNFLIII
ncbi:unnamed protein product [Lactuca virosa]|uniref:Uncharacterized protein n=1 Tax=Lactuca virosa TaxID=75947 RepID=A0AAU9MQH8_9ASTR|nr:unnamed protein product [Lactuca virosa]